MWPLLAVALERALLAKLFVKLVEERCVFESRFNERDPLAFSLTLVVFVLPLLLAELPCCEDLCCVWCRLCGDCLLLPCDCFQLRSNALTLLARFRAKVVAKELRIFGLLG